MKVEMKTAIMPKQFLVCMMYIILQFIGFIGKADKTWFDYFWLIINIASAVFLMLAGIENPSVSKFFADVGNIMLDFRTPVKVKYERIQQIWQPFSLMWLALAEEVAAEDEKEKKKIDPIVLNAQNVLK